MKKTLQTFVVLSLIIAAALTFFVVVTHQQQKAALDESLREKIKQVRSSLSLELSSKQHKMEELASYVASFPAVRQLFLAGRRAVENEGGGVGGEDAAKVRDKLLTVSQDIWFLLGQGFDVLQMHYHLPGKATSFLRVHKPDAYGDQLSPFRQMLIDAHESESLVGGLEVGRINLSLRGVAPVYAYDAELGRDVYVGTLEFAKLLERVVNDVAANQNVGLAILLDMEQLEQMVWPEQLGKKLREKVVVENYVVEEASFPHVDSFFRKVDIDFLLSVERTEVHRCTDGAYHWLASFPLRDYWGEKDPARTAIGQVVLSNDVTETYLALQHNLYSNSAYALLGFVFIEILLWFGLRYTSRKLELMVEVGRRQLADKNLQLQDELNAKEKLQQQREELIDELMTAMEDVKALSGLLPICSYCKKIRDDEGYWQRLEGYIETHSEAQFSHGICNDCLGEHFPDVKKEIRLSHLKEGSLPKKE
ncbi:hypothetical protein SAMN02745165_01986 [Malonomonas rubra DSM 5091]|uniref:Double Cache domain-containing protein n=1 Tax=Malonomonas rubra DSM 5091 TaxID=1122189 RepID=A0A1M6I2N5_MALRU|nr:cache domain-containing protein [Malonomonas rubra]SHJ28718.1 hypothetical protein SAMN02745165_01986 [Malonomonas rubra DSM 5091]